MERIILATSSPYRIEAFRSLGIDFISEGSNVNEKSNGRPQNPRDLVLYLARLKAEDVVKKFKFGIFIGFDSVAYFQRQILEKPETKQEAFDRLKSLSGKDYQFYTGIYILNTNNSKTASKVVVTDISLKRIGEDEIEKYLRRDSNFNTYAQGFNPLEGLGSTFIKEIRGSYNNVLRGIPLEVVIDMLDCVGVPEE